MTVTTTWLGTVSSNWQDAQNWSNGVPVNGSGMDAVVNAAPVIPVLANTDVGGITLTLRVLSDWGCWGQAVSCL
jgi:hypothetical protein